MDTLTQIEYKPREVFSLFISFFSCFVYLMFTYYLVSVFTWPTNVRSPELMKSCEIHL